MMPNAGFSVIVLAGDRGPGDPLAAAGGVAGKVLVEISGKPMLTYVMEAVSKFVVDGRILIVCPNGPAYLEAADVGRDYKLIEPASGPAASALAALEHLESDVPVLLVTGDHPLLQPAWLEQFASTARDSGADAVVGLVDHARIVERFPSSRRTRYRFSDVSVCGTNLFFFASSHGRRIVEYWYAFEADRKKPWRIVRRLGLWNLLRYLIGALSLAGALESLSRRSGVRLEAVMVNAPEAAVDVDSPADLALATEIIDERKQNQS